MYYVISGYCIFVLTNCGEKKTGLKERNLSKECSNSKQLHATVTKKLLAMTPTTTTKNTSKLE